MLAAASVDELNSMLSAVKTEITKRQPSAKDMVEIIPNFCTDKDFIQDLWEECESLHLSGSKNKVATQWLSPTSDPYIYSDINPVHTAKDISLYPNICKMLSFVNLSEAVDGPLDACLVLKYPSPSAVLRPHADDEPLIDQTKPICPFTLGSTRTIEFFTRGKKSKCAVQHKLDNGSLLVMKPGTQQILDHCVRAERKNSSASSADGVRYSLSFRAINTKPIAQNSTPQPSPTPEPAAVDKSKPAAVIPSQPKHHVCVVAGDSFAARLDPVRLGRNRVKVVNIAKGGSKILDVVDQLSVFLTKNTDVIIDKLIISVGTNDIRYCSNGIDHLKGPLKKLCYTIEQLIPGTKIFFQSLIPLPLKYIHDFNTPRNIESFNKILFDVCLYKRFYYIDAFYSFLQPRYWGRPQLRNEQLFNINDIHPNARGLGILARFYIFALTSRYFNPLVFQ